LSSEDQESQLHFLIGRSSLLREGNSFILSVSFNQTDGNHSPRPET